MNNLKKNVGNDLAGILACSIAVSTSGPALDFPLRESRPLTTVIQVDAAILLRSNRRGNMMSNSIFSVFHLKLSAKVPLRYKACQQLICSGFGYSSRTLGPYSQSSFVA